MALRSELLELPDSPEAQRLQIDAVLKLAAVGATREDMERDRAHLAQAHADPPAAQIEMAAAGQPAGRLVHPAQDLEKQRVQGSEDAVLLAADEEPDHPIRLGGQRRLAGGLLPDRRMGSTAQRAGDQPQCAAGQGEL